LAEIYRRGLAERNEKRKKLRVLFFESFVFSATSGFLTDFAQTVSDIVLAVAP
jgi:hypothetical protein